MRLKGILRYQNTKERRKKGMKYFGLTEIMVNFNQDQRRIIFMDESYSPKNYCLHDESLYDSNDEQYLHVKA